MKTKQHIISSLFLMPIIFAFTKNYFFAVLSGIITILVDIDHIIDFIITQKKIDTLPNMHQAFETFKYVKKNYFIFHSWEIIILLFFGYYFFKNEIFIILCFSIALHLLLDQIYNSFFLKKYSLKLFFYFFIYRLYHKFDVLSLRKYGHLIKEDEMIYE